MNEVSEPKTTAPAVGVHPVVRRCGTCAFGGEHFRIPGRGTHLHCNHTDPEIAGEPGWGTLREWYAKACIAWTKRPKRLTICPVCRIPGCIERRGLNFHAGRSFGSVKCDYTRTPPFADAAWAGKNQNPAYPMCEWCAGTGHPYGDESYGMCECPGLKPNAAVDLTGVAGGPNSKKDVVAG